MNTYTPRNTHRQFESWNSRIENAQNNERRKAQYQIQQAGQYNGTDAAVGMAAAAVGAAMWEVGKYYWVKNNMTRKIKRFFS